MTEQKRRSRGAGGGGGSLITLTWIILLILKLTGPLAHMKWYWVFSPIWISIGLGLVFLMIIGFILLLAVVGIVGASSGAVVGIKSWFQKQEAIQEEEYSDKFDAET